MMIDRVDRDRDPHRARAAAGATLARRRCGRSGRRSRAGEHQERERPVERLRHSARLQRAPVEVAEDDDGDRRTPSEHDRDQVARRVYSDSTPSATPGSASTRACSRDVDDEQRARCRAAAAARPARSRPCRSWCPPAPSGGERLRRAARAPTCSVHCVPSHQRCPPARSRRDTSRAGSESCRSRASV